MEKSPIELVPKSIYDRNNNITRFNDIQEAIARRWDSNLKIPIEWIEEYNEYIEKINTIDSPITLESNAKTLERDDVNEGDFFYFAHDKYPKLAMQVMECWNNLMTVKYSTGCISKEYHFFKKITDLNKFKIFSNSEYFEDNRSN